MLDSGAVADRLGDPYKKVADAGGHMPHPIWAPDSGFATYDHS